MTDLRTWEEVKAEFDQWHNDHPWRSRYLTARSHIREAWWTIRTAPRRWYQRARYGYNYVDLWNFDGHITGVIARAMRDLQTNGHHVFHCSAEVETIAKTFERYETELDEPGVYDDAVKAMHLFADNLGRMWD